MSTSRVRTVALLAAGALAFGGLAGCGGDVEESNEYVDAVNAAQSDFARTFDGLQREIDAGSTSQDDAQTLAGFQRAIADVVKDLRAAEPPEDVAEEHDTLVEEIMRYGKIIGAAREEFGSDDPREILEARTQLSTDVAATSTRINQAIDAINRGLRE
jgi:hypothetical protein